jgi:hypothetical protein
MNGAGPTLGPVADRATDQRGRRQHYASWLAAKHETGRPRRCCCRNLSVRSNERDRDCDEDQGKDEPQ